MSATRFALYLRDGSCVEGAVHGAGGLVAARGCERLARAMDRARDGRDTGLYEPRPGFVRVYPHATALDAGEHVDVDLRQVRGVSIVAEESP